MEFDIYEAAFNRANWAVEPSLSWDQLLDLRAQQLAAKNKPLILGFSGGSDSLTIYQVLKRNNIRLEAVRMRTKTTPEERMFYDEPLEFIKNEQKEQGFKLINSQESLKGTHEFYDSPNWWERSNIRQNWFAVGIEGLSVERSSEIQGHGISDDYIYITGHEKPMLKVKDNKFYSYLLDLNFNNYYEPRLEYFYVSSDLPDLHIKQSYMLARYMLGLSKKYQRPVSMFEKIWNETVYPHYKYSIEGCGRFGDMGYSHLQKAMNRSMKLIIPNKNIDQLEYQGRSKGLVYESVKEKRSFLRNYLEGLIELKADPIMSKAFAPGDDYRLQLPIESKGYELGIPAI